MTGGAVAAAAAVGAGAPWPAAPSWAKWPRYGYHSVDEIVARFASPGASPSIVSAIVAAAAVTVGVAESERAMAILLPLH